MDKVHLELLPDEILLLVLRCVLCAEDLLTLTIVSKRLRSLATDDTLWQVACAGIAACDTTVRASDFAPLDVSSWGYSSHFTLWLRLLRYWESFIGIWVENNASPPDRHLLHIYLNHAKSAIGIQRVYMKNVFDMLAEISDQNVRWGPYYMGTEYSLPCVGLMDPSEGWIAELRVQCYTPRLTRFDVIKGQAHGKRPSELGLALGPVDQPAPRWSPTGRSGHQPFPAPALSALWSDSRTRQLMKFEEYRHYGRIALGDIWQENTVPDADCPIENGLYTAFYETHGIELFFVRTRTLTQADFQPSGEHAETQSGDDIEIPDFHYGPIRGSKPLDGPFVGGRSPNTNIQPEHVRPGQRILEVTKIYGDSYVPDGKTSLVAFLDLPDHLADNGYQQVRTVSADMRQSFSSQTSRTRNLHPEDTQTRTLLPKTSSRSQLRPWPMSAASRSQTHTPSQAHLGPTFQAHLGPTFEAMNYEQMMQPGEGWTANGVGRIANMGFLQPRWTEALVHFEARDEFQVNWLQSVVKFKLWNTL